MFDIGSRNGESIEEFLRWPFETIHAFEPMPVQAANIAATYGTNPRVVAHHCGVSDQTGIFPVYGTDDHGEASLFPTKVDLDARTVTDCRFMRASTVFEEYVTDPVIVKLNCEGAEVAILNDLMDTGQIKNVYAVRIEFDISRVLGHEHEADQLIARLDDHNVNYTIGSDARIVNGQLIDRIPQLGTHHERLHQWLASVL